VVEFFHSSTIVIGKGYLIEEEIRKREKEMRKSPCYKGKVLLREVKSRHLPNRERTTITLNFMELLFPDEFWEVESKYKLSKTIYKKSKDKGIKRLPAFSLPRFESQKPVIRTFDSNFSNIQEYIKGEPYKRQFSTLSYKRKIELLNAHFRRWIWCKGLRRYNDIFFMPYETLNIDTGVKGNSPILIKGVKKSKVVTRPLFDNNKFNFVEHHAIRIKLGTLEGKFGIFLWPKFIFTENGVDVIEGERAKRIYRHYRNPDYLRNSNKRSELKFWSHFIINGPFILKKDSWFKDFKFKALKEETIWWSSKTLSLNEQPLTNFFGD